MKRKIIYIVYIFIILLNLIYIFLPKSTYVYFIEDYTYYIHGSDEKKTINCKIEDKDTVVLQNRFYIYDDNGKLKYTNCYYPCWKFEAISEGSTKVYLYHDYGYTRPDDLLEKDAMKEIILNVDKNNKFKVDYTFEFVMCVYRHNIYIILLCIILMILPKVRYINNPEDKLYFLRLMIRCSYIILGVNLFINNRGELAFYLFLIPLVLLCRFFRKAYIKLYEKNEPIWNILFYMVTLLLIGVLYLIMIIYIKRYIKPFFIFVIACVIHCCITKRSYND